MTRTTTLATAPLHKEEGEAVERAQETEAEAEAKDNAGETTQIAEDGPRPAEGEVAEADQLEGQDLKTCNEHCRTANGKLQKEIIKQCGFCVDPYCLPGKIWTTTSGR